MAEGGRRRRDCEGYGRVQEGGTGAKQRGEVRLEGGEGGIRIGRAGLRFSGRKLRAGLRRERARREGLLPCLERVIIADDAAGLRAILVRQGCAVGEVAELCKALLHIPAETQPLELRTGRRSNLGSGDGCLPKSCMPVEREGKRREGRRRAFLLESGCSEQERHRGGGGATHRMLE